MNAMLVVLMRWPRPGEGKTRLAAEIGMPAAHRLHCAFVADTLAWPAPRPRLLAVAPDDAACSAARAMAPDARVVRQADGHLGARIAAALQAGLRAHTDVAVLVGTDSPSLPHHLIDACISAARDTSQAAMVPAADGGFVALAVTRDAAARDGLCWLADGAIEWSTEHTAAQTRSAARRAGVEIHLTPPWHDVDAAADLVRLHTDLRADPERAPRTLHRLDTLGVAGALELAS